MPQETTIKPNIEVLGIYEGKDVEKHVHREARTMLSRPVKVVAVREGAESQEYNPLYEYRVEDDKGDPVGIQAVHQPGTRFTYVAIEPGYGGARKSMNLKAAMQGVPFAQIPIGDLPPSVRVLQNPAPRHGLFACTKSIPYDGISNSVEIKARKPLSPDRRYQFRLLRATYYLPTKPQEWISYSNVLSDVRDTVGLALPNADHQAAAEVQVRTFLRKEQKDTVEIDGAEIEEIYGHPYLRINSDLSVRSKLGVVISLPRQRSNPSAKTKRKSRILWAPFIGSRMEGVERDGFEFGIGPSFTYDLVSPRPEDLNIDSIRLSDKEYSSKQKATAPIKAGPVALRFSIKRVDWTLEKEESMILPIEEGKKPVNLTNPRYSRPGPAIPPRPKLTR